MKVQEDIYLRGVYTNSGSRSPAL